MKQIILFTKDDYNIIDIIDIIDTINEFNHENMNKNTSINLHILIEPEDSDFVYVCQEPFNLEEARQQIGIEFE